MFGFDIVIDLLLFDIVIGLILVSVLILLSV